MIPVLPGRKPLAFTNISVRKKRNWSFLKIAGINHSAGEKGKNGRNISANF